MLIYCQLIILKYQCYVDFNRIKIDGVSLCPWSKEKNQQTKYKLHRFLFKI